MATTLAPSISDHAGPADTAAHRGFGPRVRRLHGRIGAAHHQAEGMAFSRALLQGQARADQLAALIRALAPAYQLIEAIGPELAAGLGAEAIPWEALGRSEALRLDVASLAALPATPASPAAQAWLERLQSLARQAPHRFMAHVYVRYGGDLSGGQQLGEQARRILAARGLPDLHFWHFEADCAALKHGLHQGFEQLRLSEAEEQELLEEAVLAFGATQRLLAELGEIGSDPAPAAAPDPAASPDVAAAGA
jgi:heme oxygenase